MEQISTDVISNGKIEKIALICSVKNKDPRFSFISCDGNMGKNEFNISITSERITLLDKKRLNEPKILEFGDDEE